LDKITNEYVTDEELNLTKSSMAGGFARSLERPQTIAQFALNIIRNNLSKDYYQTYLKRLEAVDKEAVLTMAQTYFSAKNCNIVVVGNEEVLERLKIFDADGVIEMLDAFGDPVKETKKADITKEQLVERYVLAVTATSSMKAADKKLKKIKSVRKATDLNMAKVPFPLKMTDIWMAPNMDGMKMEGQGMVFQKAVFEGTTGSSWNMQGGKKEMSAEDIAAKNKSTGLLPELNYGKTGMSYELVGIENVDGKDAYVLKVMDGQSETYEYYDAATYLKVKTVSIRTEEGETTEMSTSYSDYKDVNGILFAHSLVISVGEAGFSGTVTSIEVNAKIDLKEFK
jgi:predicted site-specific integrase-resolvase